MTSITVPVFEMVLTSKKDVTEKTPYMNKSVLPEVSTKVIFWLALQFSYLLLIEKIQHQYQHQKRYLQKVGF